MNTHIALVRGINVGGHKKFPKVDQLKMAEQLGFKNSQLYLHTGNWVFSSEDDAGAVSKKISEAILEKYGWEVPVLVLEASELKHIFEGCPFSEAIIEKSYFTLLEEKPASERIGELKKYSYPNEEYHITETCIYSYPALGAGKAKMTNNFFENKLKVTATSRNYRTMAKLVSMIENS
jgi:uncharacterized protein (DUF1697 family)